LQTAVGMKVPLSGVKKGRFLVAIFMAAAPCRIARWNQGR